MSLRTHRMFVFAACLALMRMPGSALAQSAPEPISVASAATHTTAGHPLTGDFINLPTSDLPDGDLKLVVALFRHGVRSPTKDFGERKANEHSGAAWPSLSDWQVMKKDDCDKGQGWAYLTIQGQKLARALGAFYGKEYRRGTWSNGFTVYLWADAENQRTRETANALAQGFVDAGIRKQDVTVASLPACAVDPLFHPFKKGCGTPSAKHLLAISSNISVNAQSYIDRHKVQFDELYKVLACPGIQKCVPLSAVRDNTASSCPRPTDSCSSPIKWQGQFAYASTATEAFLLEYGNGMTVGWNSVTTPALKDMLGLHEFYFDQTEREQYLARIGGSNLAKEILDLLRAKAGWQIDGCPHASSDKQFVGLVGHDTNIASVGSLLKLTWNFSDKSLPDDTRGLPDNDSLPAGALVFELRKGTPKPPDEGYFVRVYYVAQSLDQMRKEPSRTTAFSLPVEGPLCQGGPLHCDIPLIAFNQAVRNVIGKEFLSRCDKNKQQVCP